MRIGDYTGTYTGNQFWPLDPKPEEVRLEDIAHALSQICRFNGHTEGFYSVAHHSLNVAHYLKKGDHDDLTQLYGLLHDSAEAYICDIPRPLKRFLTGYKEIEESIMQVIYQHCGLEIPSQSVCDSIKQADDYILAIEARELMKNTSDWNLVKTKSDDKLFFTVGNPISAKNRWRSYTKHLLMMVGKLKLLDKKEG